MLRGFALGSSGNHQAHVASSPVFILLAPAGVVDYFLEVSLAETGLWGAPETLSMEGKWGQKI